MWSQYAHVQYALLGGQQQWWTSQECQEFGLAISQGSWVASTTQEDSLLAVPIIAAAVLEKLRF